MQSEYADITGWLTRTDKVKRKNYAKHSTAWKLQTEQRKIKALHQKASSMRTTSVNAEKQCFFKPKWWIFKRNYM